MHLQMKKLLQNIISLLLLVPASVAGQSYSTLWKQAGEASDKDLPQTQMAVLDRIKAKAEKEKEYGQLLKAELLRMKVCSEVAPDSLKPAVERLRNKCAAASDAVLKAVRAAVLCRIYNGHPELDDSAKAIADGILEYYRNNKCFRAGCHFESTSLHFRNLSCFTPCSFREDTHWIS